VTKIAEKPDRNKAKAKPETCRMILMIGGTSYTVRLIPSEDGRAYRLRKDDGIAYHVAESPHGPHCDYPSFIWRSKSQSLYVCKHIRACVAFGMLDGYNPQ
jgi:hypothetical protein